MHRLVGVFHGARLKHREFDGFTCSENTYPPDLRIVSHRHERPYYSLVLAGSYTEQYGSRTRDCNRLSASLHPPEERHSDRFSGAGGRLFSVEFKPALLGRMADLGVRLRDPLDFQGGLPVQLGYRLYREFQRQDGPSQLSLEGVTLELLAEISRLKLRSSTLPPLWLRRARDILHATFSSPPTLFDLAATAGVHPVHLAREFRRHFSCTAGEYVRRRRIDFACRALLQTESPLAEIAIKAGFSDQSHLTRTFRAATGLPPAQFRKHYRGKSGSTPLKAFKTRPTPS